MKRTLLENRIRKIVSETINKFVLNETFTNMKQLYHEMPINALVNMIRVNSFFLLPSNHPGRGGKYYASLTRHKNSIEGFDSLLYAEESRDEVVESFARITFNIPKLSRVHGISIKPFDYYATPYGGSHSDYGHSHTSFDNGGNTKRIYQLLKKPRNLMDDDELDAYETGEYDAPEYYNMAEENIISDTVREIPGIFNYIDEIILHFPVDLEKGEYYNDDEDEDFISEAYTETFMYGHALCKLICGTPWESKTSVKLCYDNGTSKMISMSDFSEWLKEHEDHEVNSKYADSFLSRNPRYRYDYYSGYEDRGRRDYYRGYEDRGRRSYDYGHGYDDSDFGYGHG